MVNQSWKNWVVTGGNATRDRTESPWELMFLLQALLLLCDGCSLNLCHLCEAVSRLHFSSFVT